MSNPETAKPSHYIAPKFWPMWFFFFLLWLTTKLPFSLQFAIGRALGRFLHRIGKKRRLIAKTNIGLVFPELSDAEQDALVKKNFESTGISVIEIGLCWWGSERRLKKLVHFSGLEHFEQAKQQGKGVLLLSGHTTSMLIGGHLANLTMPFHIFQKKAKNPLFEAMNNRYRTKHYPGVYDSQDLRGILSHLKKGGVCWYAPDQDFGPSQSVFAPFMGVECATLQITPKLAKHATVVPMYFERLPNNQGYRINLHPALENYPSGNAVQDATTTNRHLEEQVRKIPEQYLWTHRRFKSRPEGEAPIY